MLIFPEDRITFIERRFGDAGRRWVRTQHDVLQQVARDWSLEGGEVYQDGLRINACFKVNRDGEALVLKTGYPEPELFTEIEMLKLWRGRAGCVQLVEVDEAHGIMLLARANPGIQFRKTDPAVRSSQIPDVHRKVPLPVAGGEFPAFPTYESWCEKAFFEYRQGETDPQFLNWIEHAELLLGALLDRHEENWLLHGDLHHQNILSHGDTWVAIDPKGVMGPRVIEYGRFMHNFIADETGPDLQRTYRDVLLERADTLAGEYALGTLVEAGFVDLVLSMTWTLNAGGDLNDERRGMLGNYADVI